MTACINVAKLPRRLDHHRLVRQFVAGMAVGRKVLREFARHGFDAIDHAALEIPGPEISLHHAADGLPALGTDLGIDAAVGDDLDVAVGQQQIDQHAVVVRGVPDAQMRELIQRPLARRLVAEQRRTVQRAFPAETDLAGMRRLAAPDRLLDPGEHGGREYPLDPPMMFEKVPADALDVHVSEPCYQLPDAPPPPKLPPPPLNPLSLSRDPPPPLEPPPE